MYQDNQDNFFDRANDIVRDTETSLVNFLSAIAPWLAPLAPAYLTWSHMQGELGFPWWVALAVSGVVEILGLSATFTVLRFWSHNRKYTKSDRKAPVIVPVISFVFYMVVIMSVNVLLEASKEGLLPITPAWARIWAILLLVLLSLPATLIIGVRTLHNELLEDIEDERDHRRKMRMAARLPAEVVPVVSNMPHNGSGTKKKAKFFVDVRSGRFQKMLDDGGLELSAATIASLYETSERNAFRWLAEIKNLQGETRDN